MYSTWAKKTLWLHRLRRRSNDRSEDPASSPLASTPATTFPFSELPVKLQTYILQLALTNCIPPDPHCSTSVAILGATSGRFLLGLELPPEGIFTASKRLSVLSMATYYALPEVPPVYLTTPCQGRGSMWPFFQIGSDTFVTDTYSQRARFWQRVIVPFRACWMGAHGEIHALSTVLSRMYNVVELRLDIRLRDPQTVVDQRDSGYHEWQMVVEALALLPRLDHIEFRVGLDNRHLVSSSSSAVLSKQKVDYHRVTPALGLWLIENDREAFGIVHEERLSRFQSLLNLYHSLEFVYYVLIARYRNTFDKGSIPRPDFLDNVQIHSL